jgi:hypothetical protein
MQAERNKEQSPSSIPLLGGSHVVNCNTVAELKDVYALAGHQFSDSAALIAQARRDYKAAGSIERSSSDPYWEKQVTVGATLFRILGVEHSPDDLVGTVYNNQIRAFAGIIGDGNTNFPPVFFEQNLSGFYLHPSRQGQVSHRLEEIPDFNILPTPTPSRASPVSAALSNASRFHLYGAMHVAAFGGAYPAILEKFGSGIGDSFILQPVAFATSLLFVAGLTAAAHSLIRKMKLLGTADARELRIGAQEYGILPSPLAVDWAIESGTPLAPHAERSAYMAEYLRLKFKSADEPEVRVVIGAGHLEELVYFLKTERTPRHIVEMVTEDVKTNRRINEKPKGLYLTGREKLVHYVQGAVAWFGLRALAALGWPA